MTQTAVRMRSLGHTTWAVLKLNYLDSRAHAMTQTAVCTGCRDYAIAAVRTGYWMNRKA
jgi:hypothetical protein